jgi:ribosomal protein L31E
MTDMSLRDNKNGECTYNVNLRRVRSTTVAVASNAYCIICAFIASHIQHTTRMRHIAICALPGSTIFSHIIS